MSKKAIKSNFFTDLDSIFDTRLGTLLTLSEANLVDFKLISSPEFFKDYVLRPIDVFKGVDRQLFNDRYLKRDVKVLKNSLITKVVKEIWEFGLLTHQGNIYTPIVKDPGIILNTYPYEINDELKTLISDTLLKVTGKISRIKLVNMSYSDLTPNYLKSEHVSIITLYDPAEWLETQTINSVFSRESCPQVMMIGPIRIRNQDHKVLDTDTLIQFKKHMEMFAKPFVDLKLMSPNVFSADIAAVTRQ